MQMSESTMDGPVVELLKRTGGSTVDEILAVVPVRPLSISSNLRKLSNNGYIKVTGPKTISDFDALIKRIKSLNGYETYSTDKQRSCVLKEILEHETGFTKTTVRLSLSGFKLALK